MSAAIDRRIVANLDCETEFAAMFAGGARAVPAALPEKAKLAFSLAATCLRVFAASDADRLWLPAAVDAARMAAVPGLPMPILESGPIEDLPPAAHTLAWGATRTRFDASARFAGGDGDGPLPLHELVWRLPRASANVAAMVNHREFALHLSEKIGAGLPGARMVQSADELAAHLAAGGAHFSPTSEWVVKAPLSAAGRERAIGKGREIPAGAIGGTIAKLFAAHGELLFEPWMPRTADFGITGLLAPEGVVWLGVHRLDVDATGRFLGTVVSADREFPAMPASFREQLAAASGTVATMLAAANYVGPFGIDAYMFRTADGTDHLRPIGEINARLTFGIVARAFLERLREPLNLGDAARLRLCVAGLRQESREALAADFAERVPVLWADDGQTPAAWLDIAR